MDVGVLGLNRWMIFPLDVRVGHAQAEPAVLAMDHTHEYIQKLAHRCSRTSNIQTTFTDSRVQASMDSEQHMHIDLLKQSSLFLMLSKQLDRSKSNWATKY